MKKKLLILLTCLCITGCGPSQIGGNNYTTKQLNANTTYEVLDIRETGFGNASYTISIVLSDELNNRYYLSYSVATSIADGTKKDDTYLKLALLCNGDMVKAGKGDYNLILVK